MSCMAWRVRETFNVEPEAEIKEVKPRNQQLFQRSTNVYQFLTNEQKLSGDVYVASKDTVYKFKLLPCGC